MGEQAAHSNGAAIGSRFEGGPRKISGDGVVSRRTLPASLSCISAIDVKSLEIEQME